MPSLNDWLDSTGTIASSAERAITAWRRIVDRPTQVTLDRLGVAQTMRVEFDDTATEQNNDMRTIGHQYLVVFGVRDHPVIADTDIQWADRFVLDNVEFEVMALIKPPGEVQALCESRTS